MSERGSGVGPAETLRLRLVVNRHRSIESDHIGPIISA